MTVTFDETVPFERPEWTAAEYRFGKHPICEVCGLERREHINSVYCPEWRLRQLDGDR